MFLKEGNNLTIENNFLDNKEEVYINEKLITDNNFKEISQLDKEILAKKGFYCIRLKEKSKLPSKYQAILETRKYC